MRRLCAVALALALPGCVGDAPTELVSRPAANSAVLFSETCVYFTEDGAKIPDSEDCTETAFGIDIDFVPKATIGLVQGATLESPQGITGLRASFHPTGPDHGELTSMQWRQQSRTLSQDVLPGAAAGSSSFDVKAKKFIDVRWIGGGKIDIPKGANDLHYFVRTFTAE